MTAAIGIAAFAVIFGAVTVWVSLRLHDSRCHVSDRYNDGYFFQHPAFCCWLGCVVIVAFAVAITVLIDANDYREGKRDGCPVTVPYGSRQTIICSEGES